MANNINSGESPFLRIPFQDKNYRLTREWLGKYTDDESRNNDDWRWPTLKFLSFQQDQLTLLNTSQDRSFKLTLMVKGNRLLVSCNCDNQKSSLCEHAYAGLYTLLWHLGDCYFEKLQPHGAMALAFAHKKYFDKKESTAGINLSPRPELKSVFYLDSKVENIDLPAILKLPATQQKIEKSHSDYALSYLVIISHRNKLLPALMPCMGRLNKNRNEIKTWNNFLTGIQKQYNHILTDTQKEINTACYHLWKMIEKTPGHIIQEKPKKESTKNLSDIFNAWQNVLPSLQKQPFVYAYFFYGVRELKNKPAKRRVEKVIISDLMPSVEFELLDKGPFYRFQMRVRVNGKLLSNYDAGASFFIQHQQTLYMLPSLRDAAFAEWLHRSGGWITVFKEHYAQFEREVLEPLRGNYTIDIRSLNRKK